ncbi:MAG TPA: hypothetical protein VJI97_02765 [Candidatus Nanoarchaeia archaeon]|nr:hypothetical protein [Candidatus Nanoarchaeia archaeon]
MEIAQQFYEAWLKSEGIDDSWAMLEPNFALGWRGMKGPERALESGRAYDILPHELLVEINRAVAGLKPANKSLVARLKRHSPDGTLVGRLAA